MPRVDFPLYLVTDRQQTGGRSLVPLVGQAAAGGLRAVQVRERDLATRDLCAVSQELCSMMHAQGGRVMINDRADLVLALGADGVHLRADSLPVSVARRVLGSDRLIGVSAHSLDEVVRAESEGADFAVLGPVYETPSKRDYGPPIGLHPLEEASRRCRIPVYAIGGITVARAAEVRRAGAYGVAVVSAILSAASAESATRKFLDALARA
ncbi:MAG TPA: thiamine phosphate synthase [Nitrospiraceae bacterium]|jgi:thiamine-phosphate pyrophosphorylase